MTTYRKTMAEALKDIYLGENNLEKMRKASKGAAQTLKMKDGNIKMDSFTASAIMQIYDKINDKNKKTFENMMKNGKKADIVKLMKFAMSKVNAEYVPEEFEEEFELDEAKYDLYHKDFSTAMQHSYKMAKKLYGITVDPKEIDDKVASGPKKPSEGKTNSYRLKGDKGAIQVQVYNKGGSKPFELNMYKEEVELDESKKALKAKSEKSGVSVGILSKVYDRGMAAWKTGHRPGTTPQQWALARVNSFLTGGGARKADNDLWQQAKKQKAAKKEEVEIAEDGHADVPSAVRQCKTVMEDATQILSKLMAMGPEDSLPTWWTNKLAVASNNMNKMRDYLLVSSEMKEELEEALDKDDEATVKRIVGKLKKASQAHAGQAKDLEKAMDEKRHRDVDPADVDTSATDDDIKAADKNIMMQLRKSVSLRGNFPVEFMDKKKVKIPMKIAQAVLNKHNSFRKPMDKEKFQAKVAKSHRDLLSALKESIVEGGYVGRKDPMPAGKELAKLMKKKSKKEETKLNVIHRQLREK